MAGARSAPQEPTLPQDQDFKRLVRARMGQTGQRYTEARAALLAERDGPVSAVSDRTRSVLGQLADVEMAAASLSYLTGLTEPERRAAGIAGLGHPDWRVRRSCAQLLDRVDLTDESLAALTRALDDPHPLVRRNAVHSLACEHCKPNSCAVDVPSLFAQLIGDPSRLVRSMVLHVCAGPFDQQWAINLVAGMATGDPSAKLREAAEAEIDYVRQRWDADAERRTLPEDLIGKTERHPRRWIAIRDGRIVAVHNGQARIYHRALQAGATRYWVPPANVSRPRIPTTRR